LFLIYYFSLDPAVKPLDDKIFQDTLSSEMKTLFQLQRSYNLCIFLLFAHIGSIFCIYYITLAFWQKMSLATCILTSLIITIRKYALQNNPEAIIEFWLNSDKSWALKKRRGGTKKVFLDLPIFVSNYLIILNFTSVKKFLKITVPITKNDFSANDSLRKLKVLLKTTRHNSK
jgi:hypothetical protein